MGSKPPEPVIMVSGSQVMSSNAVEFPRRIQGANLPLAFLGASQDAADIEYTRALGSAYARPADQPLHRVGYPKVTRWS
jgi:hypothetical protein